MPPGKSEDALAAIQKVVARYPEGASLSEIAKELTPSIKQRTLQYRLHSLVASGRLLREGQGSRSTRYRVPPATAEEPIPLPKAGEIALSPSAERIRQYLARPLAARTPVGYNRDFLEAYRPNVTFYLSEAQRDHLAQVGTPGFPQPGAGTYAKNILNRLLIDLAWNSSRLEGNTYSLLDTRRLIELGEAAVGRDRLEAQMIVNHKEAIEFLVNDADEIGFNRYTILNLHGILAQNLLPDPAAPGRLRSMGVGIERSTFHPLELPQWIEECFDQLLATASAIRDPFEQAFFAMVQLPYLQPFDDVNKRVSRLAANIPFIRHNLSPLSFTDVPRGLYTEAILGVYELNQVDLLREVFVWAYERSAAQYAAVRQSLGEPDPFRVQHSAALREVVAHVVRNTMTRRDAVAYIAAWVEQTLPEADRERFRDMAETELLSLHDGNFARYRIRPSEFASWQQVWNSAQR